MPAGKLRLLTLLGAALLFAASAAFALSLKPPPEMACPLDGEKFRRNGNWVPDEEHLGSHRDSWRSLDLKEIGKTTFSPWPLPQCPSSGFVVYKRDFSATELDRLRRYVMSPQYQALKAAHTRHYLAATLRNHMGETPVQLRYTLLYATWEANPEQYVTYAAEALAAFKQALAASGGRTEIRMRDELIAGELERRLGRFTDAHARFSRLSSNDPAVRDVVRVQLQLVTKKEARRCSLNVQCF